MIQIYNFKNDGLETEQNNKTATEVKAKIQCGNIEFLQIFEEGMKVVFSKPKEAIENKGLFIVKTTNEWMEEAKHKPKPNMLYDKFWFENELCLLFSDTNVGKSIKAVQIGNSISKGQAIDGFSMEADKQKVLYFDFELSDKQFQIRYCDDSDSQNNYVFDDNFIRIEFNPNMELPKGKKMEDLLFQELESVIVTTGAKILIVDNITYLKEGTEKANDALPLMKQIKFLKSKYGLSVLALAHTPKRDLTKKLTRNDLQGSKMLMNFCDSSFAIGESHLDKNLRYIKQIKQRNCGQVYGKDNVVVCEIDKVVNFVQFKFMGYGKEFEHLEEKSTEKTVKKKQEAAVLKSQGVSNCEISRRLSVSEGTIRNWLK
jgi:hypothetical protein